MKKILIALALTIALTSACGSAPQPVMPTMTPYPTNTPTPTQIPTVTPYPTSPLLPPDVIAQRWAQHEVREVTTVSPDIMTDHCFTEGCRAFSSSRGITGTILVTSGKTTSIGMVTRLYDAMTTDGFEVCEAMMTDAGVAPEVVNWVLETAHRHWIMVWVDGRPSIIADPDLPTVTYQQQFGSATASVELDFDPAPVGQMVLFTLYTADISVSIPN